MTGRKSDALTTVEDAAEVLHLDDAELDAAIEDGTLRRVQHAGETYVLGADVDRALKDKDPRSLAALVLDGADPDDPESPKNLAAQMQRL